MDILETSAPELASGPRERPEPIKPPEAKQRVNVAVNSETMRALQHLMEREGTSLTEAVRRLVGYGEFVYKAKREDGEDLYVRAKDGSTREVVLLA